MGNSFDDDVLRAFVENIAYAVSDIVYSFQT